jgi:hypothetical protein
MEGTYRYGVYFQEMYVWLFLFLFSFSFLTQACWLNTSFGTVSKLGVLGDGPHFILHELCRVRTSCYDSFQRKKLSLVKGFLKILLKKIEFGISLWHYVLDNLD